MKPARVTKKVLYELIASVETEQWGGGDPFYVTEGRAMDAALRRVLTALVKKTDMYELRLLCDDVGLAQAINDLKFAEDVATATYDERQAGGS